MMVLVTGKSTAANPAKEVAISDGKSDGKARRQKRNDETNSDPGARPASYQGA